MIIIKDALPLNAYVQTKKSNGNKISFVPTMGALHKGHLALISAAQQENITTICSIFINPTQFTNHYDFENYPTIIEKDIELLIQSGCDVLFLPPLTEIYPTSFIKKYYELGSLENILEGIFRPGHFQGVCQVVDKLLEIVLPDQLYLGQKDFQQCLVIRKLISITNRESDLELFIVPTQRENDGLAMSSRNMRLNEAERQSATAIFEALSFMKNHIDNLSFLQLKEEALKILEQNNFVVDYVEIVNMDTLEPVKENEKGIIALIAGTIGDVRLIDNMLMN